MVQLEDILDFMKESKILKSVPDPQYAQVPAKKVGDGGHVVKFLGSRFTD